MERSLGGFLRIVQKEKGVELVKIGIKQYEVNIMDLLR